VYTFVEIEFDEVGEMIRIRNFRPSSLLPFAVLNEIFRHSNEVDSHNGCIYWSVCSQTVTHGYTSTPWSPWRLPLRNNATAPLVTLVRERFYMQPAGLTYLWATQRTGFRSTDDPLRCFCFCCPFSTAPHKTGGGNTVQHTQEQENSFALCYSNKTWTLFSPISH
jgi:hypothetical protein